ncbi:MAG: rhomboid family intramembrane serine protease [Blautia sp.]
MEEYRQYNRNPQNGGDLRRILAARKHVPVNTIIILVNLVVFLAVEATGSSENTGHMLAWGAAGTWDIYQKQQYYRLVTSMFLHFGIQHLGNNMLVLFFIGDCLEQSVGKIKYFLIYFLGGVGANIISLFLEIHRGEYVVSAGASGAVFAAIGGLLYVLLRNRGHVGNFTSRQILLLAALSLYHGISSTGVDNAAHIGGLFCGFLLGMVLYHKRSIR